MSAKPTCKSLCPVDTNIYSPRYKRRRLDVTGDLSPQSIRVQPPAAPDAVIATPQEPSINFVTMSDCENHDREPSDELGVLRGLGNSEVGGGELQLLGGTTGGFVSDEIDGTTGFPFLDCNSADDIKFRLPRNPELDIGLQLAVDGASDADNSEDALRSEHGPELSLVKINNLRNDAKNNPVFQTSPINTDPKHQLSDRTNSKLEQKPWLIDNLKHDLTPAPNQNASPETSTPAPPSRKKKAQYVRKSQRILFTRHTSLSAVTNFSHGGSTTANENSHSSIAEHILQRLLKRRECVICRYDFRHGKTGGRRRPKLTDCECSACTPSVALCGPVGSQCFIRWHNSTLRYSRTNTNATAAG
jgi:hypothetical protein